MIIQNDEKNWNQIFIIKKYLKKKKPPNTSKYLPSSHQVPYLPTYLHSNHLHSLATYIMVLPNCISRQLVNMRWK